MRQNVLATMKIMENLKEEHIKLKEIAAFLVSTGKKSYSTVIYDLARSKQNEIRKIERVLEETQIEI